MIIMENKNFKELVKMKEPKKIIYDYINYKISLTPKQLEKVIKLQYVK